MFVNGVAAHVEAVWNDIKRTNAGMLPQF